MKYLLIILLFITSFCNAQTSGEKLDSILKVFRDSGVVSAQSGTLTYPTYKGFSLFIEDKIDTIPCIMLVCDIDKKSTAYSSTMDNPKDHITIEAYYMKGYWYHPRYSEGILVAYLDENKKPLPENVIVWMSKSLNKK